MPGSLPMPGPLQNSSREAGDGGGRRAASPTQGRRGRHAPRLSKLCSRLLGSPWSGRSAMVCADDGKKHWSQARLAASCHAPANTGGSGAREPLEHQWQSSCLAAMQALNAPCDNQHLPREAARDCSRAGQ